MSKLLHCGRCNTRVVVVNNNEYITDDGKIYCDKHCHYNRNVPMVISKVVTKLKKKKNKAPANLYVVENWDAYEELKKELEGVEPNIYKMIFTVSNLTGTKWFFKEYAEKYKIKRIIYQTEVNDRIIDICNTLKNRSNGLLV